MHISSSTKILVQTVELFRIHWVYIIIVSGSNVDRWKFWGVYGRI